MSIDPSAVIHPSAVIEEGAVIGPQCRIGAYAIVGPDVTLHAGVELRPHAVVSGWTEVGEGTIIWPFASVGGEPQDLKYRGERTRLVVGKRCRIREGATLSTGTEGGGGLTQIGDDVLMMTGAHVGHDSIVGSRVVMANQVAVAGHCHIGDDVIIGGLSGIHQFVRVGRGAIIGAVTMVTNDVMPFGLVQGPRGQLDGLNLVGLKRRGLDRAGIHALRAAYEAMGQGEGTFMERVQRIADGDMTAEVREVVDFILGASDRSFLTPH